MNVFLRYLMKSSEYSDAEVKQFSVPVIREMVFRVASHITPASFIPAIFYNWYNGNKPLALVELVVVVLLVLHTYLLLGKNKRIFSPLTLLIISFAILLATVLTAIPQFIYFCFAFPVALYLLVDRRESFFLNIGWWIVCSAVAWRLLSTLDAIAYVFSHACVCCFLEILFSILARSEEQLRQLSIRDPLTDAFNRRAMKGIMENELLMHGRYGVVASIVMLDIDDFKPINDTFGHKEGDQVLQNFVAAVKTRLRPTDKICRYGGEEFVVVLPSTDRQQAYELAESICTQIRNTILSSKRKVTVSAGVSASRQNDSINDWLHRCDMALYEAKKNGRDRVELEKLDDVA